MGTLESLPRGICARTSFESPAGVRKMRPSWFLKPFSTTSSKMPAFSNSWRTMGQYLQRSGMSKGVFICECRLDCNYCRRCTHIKALELGTMSASASRTSTLTPFCARVSPRNNPTGPPPTTITSFSTFVLVPNGFSDISVANGRV